MENKKYVISYIEQGDSKLFQDGDVITDKSEYKKIKDSGYFYDKVINETVFVKKIRLLEVLEEDEISR